MASQPDEEEPGPSGLTTEETSEREGTPSQCLEEELGDSDDLCQEALDRFERQRAFQTHLLEQSGGVDAGAEGAFEFQVGNYVNRRSTRMGVHERHFNTRLRQTGNLIPDQNITEALQDALRRG